MVLIWRSWNSVDWLTCQSSTEGAFQIRPYLHQQEEWLSLLNFPQWHFSCLNPRVLRGVHFKKRPVSSHSRHLYLIYPGLFSFTRLLSLNLINKSKITKIFLNLFFLPCTFILIERGIIILIENTLYWQKILVMGSDGLRTFSKTVWFKLFCETVFLQLYRIDEQWYRLLFRNLRMLCLLSMNWVIFSMCMQRKI